MRRAPGRPTLEELQTLDRLVTDTCSVILANRVGFLLPLTQEVELLAPTGVLLELEGWLMPEAGLAAITEVPPPVADGEPPEAESGVPVDEQVIAAARCRSVPVLSDDLEVLGRAHDEGLSTYTTRLMLELLLLRRRIDLETYVGHKRALAHAIRYAVPLYVAAEEIHWEIRKAIG